MKIFSFFISFVLIGLNVLIVVSSQKKIESYEKSPPFFATDFTKSFKKNNLSQIRNLSDGDENTFWVKENDAKEFDFEIELRLTHFYSKDIRSRKFNSVNIKACEDPKLHLTMPKNLKIQVFKKEAINVDKELRLPSEKIIKETVVDFSKSLTQKISIENDLQIQESKKYPNNIFIIGVRGKITSEKKSSRPCISEITLEESLNQSTLGMSFKPPAL